ncbi:unnamed protein product, partial [Rotaria socialis]
KKQEIDTLEKKGRYKTAIRRQESLSTLEQLLELVDKIKLLEPLQSFDTQEELKATLIKGLLEHDMSDEKELEDEIKKRKQEIETLADNGKHETVRRRRNSLSALEELQVLMNRIKDLQNRKLSVSSEISPYGEGASDNSYNNKNLCGRQEGDTIMKEHVKNLYNDFCMMPPCTEKSIIHLLFFIALKLNDEAIIISENNMIIVDEIETEIVKEFELFNERINIENIQSTQVENLIGTVSVHIKDHNWKSASSTLEKILKFIRPFNISELFRLFDQINERARLIKDEDVILLLGKTGVGKSTTIHFFGGSELREVKVTGLNHIHPVEIRNPDLKQIITTPYSRSETRCITPVRVYFKDVGGYSNESIIICDTPGFEDTNGPEVDIANGIGIVKAIKGSKSVKPVVIISYKSIGDKLEGIKDLANTLIKLIPNIGDHLKTFSYIFTKFPSDKIHGICKLLTNAEETLNEDGKSDISLRQLFKDMINKTRQGARTLDPMKNDAFEILHELVESDTITHPNEVFQFFITEKSKSILQEQVRRHQLSIISATNRSDYLLVKYKLGQLKGLDDILEQEYIRQICNDCVRYVIRHLSEEYEQSIQKLNHCLLSEAILCNEDLKQYQTCIDHAKLADDLREDHVGNEVVHSIAFIQNVNQQIEAITTEVREKEINDPLVKIYLDKIKLVSSSFSDIDQDKYKSIRQIIAEKIKSVTKSFKSSVLANKFDESAKDIAKLHEALTVLQDYLDYGEGAKYVQLKEFFLNYLNDSIDRLSHIFDREKLQKDDIDSLNSCIYMLEIAKDTLALQPHIPKEAIDNIYESLLSRILNYFDQILNKINAEFKNENAFHAFEQFLLELDSLRKISIIELKTNRSYYATLENIIEYLHNSKRDIEQLLRVLFQQEEKLKYNKITKCLLSLKSSQWIENYRVGEYSSVMNDIKEQFIDHMKEMKNSVMQMTLGLDDYKEIDSTYKMILKINKMKEFEIIFTDINHYLVEVNSWFESVVKNTFSTIKDSFTIEKWKEQEYKNCEFNKVEQAFHYLDACKKFPILSNNECLSVLNGLEECIRYYSKFVENEMEISFEHIKEFQANNPGEIYKNIGTLSTRLQEVYEIETKHSRTLSCFVNQKLFQKWQHELSDYLTELSHEMEKLCIIQQTISLKDKLVVVKALSKLDNILEGGKYFDIYLKYRNVYCIKVKDISEKILNAIQNYEYEQITSEMITLKLSGDIGEHFFENNKQSLNKSLVNLIEETQTQTIMLGNHFEIDKIKTIVGNLKRIQKAKDFVSVYIDTPDELCGNVAQISSMLEHRLKCLLDETQALVYINNFYEAEKKLEFISIVRTLLGNYCTKQISDEVELIKERRYEIVSDEIVAKYSNMDIDKYILNPPIDLFEKLVQVKNINPIYTQALNKLRENIINKFRQELELAKSVRPLNQSNIHIRKFESSVKHLPETMKDVLEVELKHCKEDIDSMMKTNKN